MRKRILGFAVFLALLLVSVGTHKPAGAATLTVDSAIPTFQYAPVYGGLTTLSTNPLCRFQATSCSTSINGTLSVAQFDPSLGDLTQVDVLYTVSHAYTGVIENNSGSFLSGTWTITNNGVGGGHVVTQSTLAMGGVLGTQFLLGFTEGNKSISQGVSYLHFTNLMVSATRTEALPTISLTSLAALTAFTGTGSATFNVGQNTFNTPAVNFPPTLNGVSISGPSAAILLQEFVRSFTPQLQVTYTYDPTVVAPVPVPAALPLFVSGLAGVGYFRWRRNRRTDT